MTEIRELASVKHELVQAQEVLGNDEKRQLYSCSNLKCVERQIQNDHLAEENRQLNALLSNVQSQLASVGKLISRGTTKKAPSPGGTNGRKRRRSRRLSSDIGGRLWWNMNRSGEFGGCDSANTDVIPMDERTQAYTGPASPSLEITVSPKFVPFKNETFEEAEEEIVTQSPSDIEWDSEGASNWSNKALDAMASSELFIEEDSKEDGFVEVFPSDLDQVRSDNAAFSSLSKRSSHTFPMRTPSEVTSAAEISFECYNCKKAFADQSQLEDHMTKGCSGRIKPSHYNRSPARRSGFTRRIQNRTKERLFHCEHQSCEKSFTTKSHLTQHTRIHTGERPYLCEFPGCTKRFNQPGNLMKHTRSHSGDKPFQCFHEGCGKRFNQKSNLSSHKRLHTGETPYVCNQAGCTEAFRWKPQLDAHFRVKHLM